MTTNRGNQEKKRGAPQWATQPFKDFLEYTDRLLQLLHLSTKGISMVRGVPKAIEALAMVDDDDGSDVQTRIETAKEEAELAQREVSEGFPLLHAQATIALRSALEATIRLFVARWLQNYGPAMSVEVIQKLRVKLGEYEQLEGEDRFFYILGRLEQELSTPLKNGVTRFEILLEPFGLSGPVNDPVRRDLFELSQVRNVLVHRNGVADRRLVEACPWLGLKAGDTVRIEHKQLRRYFESVYSYVTKLIVRLGEYFGVDMSKFHDEASREGD